MTVSSPRRAPVPAVPPGRLPRRAVDGPLALVGAMAIAWAAIFAWLSVERHRAFWTGRFDLGNMVQAVWSTAHGDLLSTTDIAGRQFSRLGAHVDPILVLFAPLGWVPWTAEGLLVAQAAIVATGALPAFWLGRRWLGDDRLAVAGAAVYLLYPPLGWATVTEFHPVTLAAPLLLFCVWAAEERRDGVLVICAVLAAMCKEEVALSLVVLGIWIVVRHRRRVAGALLAAGAAAWVAIAVGVIVPAFNEGRPSEFVSRYGELGQGTGAIARTLVTRPWEALDVAVSHHRLTYLLALLLPLLLLPLLAPLLAAAALPELGLNLLADWWPQYSIEFQYVAVIVPFLVAAALLGLARLRRARRPGWLAAAVARPGPVAATMVAAVAVAGIVLGPLPWWGSLPRGYESERTHQYDVTAHARTLARAVALVPDGARVSASNYLGAHLSRRERLDTFPVVAGADWILVDRLRPALGYLIRPREHEAAVQGLLARRDLRLVFAEDGVLVFRRVGA